MLLPAQAIRAALISGRIEVDPTDMSAVQPCSLDVRLGDSFLVHSKVTCEPLAPGDPVQWTEGPRNREGQFVLYPGQFALATTAERVRLGTDVAARLEGKSSLGRLGLVLHSTAGFIDPGFEGQVTLELYNLMNLPLKLTPGMKIGQLCFIELTEPTEAPYGDPRWGSHYQGQMGATPSRYGSPVGAGSTAGS